MIDPLISLEVARTASSFLGVLLIAVSTIIAMGGQTHKDGHSKLALNWLGITSATCLLFGVIFTVTENVKLSAIEDRHKQRELELQAELSEKTSQLINLTTQPRFELIELAHQDGRHYELSAVGSSIPVYKSAERFAMFRFEMRLRSIGGIPRPDSAVFYVVDNIEIDRGTVGYGVFEREGRGLPPHEPEYIYFFDHDDIGDYPERIGAFVQDILAESQYELEVNVSVGWESCVQLEFQDTLGSTYTHYIHFEKNGENYTSGLSSRYDFDVCTTKISQAIAEDNVINYNIQRPNTRWRELSFTLPLEQVLSHMAIEEFMDLRSEERMNCHLGC